MKSIVFTEKNTLQLMDLPDPVAANGEVIIAVEASGICHTDYEVLKDNYGTGTFPVVPGHEYAGVVVDIGANITNVAIGDRVAVDPNIECGNCRACQRGWAHLCEKLGAYGVTTHGGFAEYSLVNATAVHPIGDMRFAQAALAEPMGCVLNGVNTVYAPWMENALIFGAGPMGLLMGLALKQYGISNITFCDKSDDRLELADSFGFDAVASGSGALKKWRHSADLAIEATGAPVVAEQLIDYIANGSKGLFFGVCPADARIDIAPFEVFRRQLTLVGSHSLNHNIPEALDVIAGLGTTVDNVISHRLPLHEIAKLFDDKPPSNSLKIQWST